MTGVPLIGAFLAGIISFLSPCVLPIIPGFLAYLAGDATDEHGQVDERKKKRQIFINSIFFVLGFSVIFAVIGVLLNTVLEAVAYDAQIWLARIGGLIIIFFGLYLTGLLNIGFLNREHKFTIKRKFGSRHITSFLFGAAFAAGWTPCVGAVLGAILGLAASQPGTAFSLLLVYALGLGLPFLLVGAFTSRAQKLINRLGNKLVYINKAFGFLLIVLGVFVFTQNLNLLSDFGFLNNILI